MAIFQRDKGVIIESVSGQAVVAVGVSFLRTKWIDGMGEASQDSSWRLVVQLRSDFHKLFAVRENTVSPGKNSMSSVSTMGNKHLCVVFPTLEVQMPTFYNKKTYSKESYPRCTQFGKMGRGSMGRNSVIHQTYSYFMVLKIDQIVSEYNQHKPVYLE